MLSRTWLIPVRGGAPCVFVFDVGGNGVALGSQEVQHLAGAGRLTDEMSMEIGGLHSRST